MTSPQEIINNFKNVTGANDETSKFYLEASGWNLELATESYFENGGSVPQQPTQPIQRAPEPTPVPSRPPVSTQSHAAKDRKGVVGFSDFRSEDSKGQNYFTGGAKSGMMVQDPQADKDGEGNNYVDNLLENARKHQFQDEEEEVKEEKEKFSGSGYRLGNIEGPGYKVPAGQTTSEKKDVHKTITLWKQGFTVDDGPIRGYEDPANKAFLDSVGRGEVPQELEQGLGRARLHVNIESKKDEEYKPPPVVLKPFSGEGHSLGGPISRAPQIRKPTTKPKEVVVDESQPTTTVQIRLHNGTRVVQKFNHTHTVADIRSVVDAKGPFPNYRLQTPLPVKILEDTQTIKEANLLNAVIVQQLI